jgi:serine O-acetyltransferase
MSHIQMNHKKQSFFETLHQNQKNKWVKEINSSIIIDWLDQLFDILFPQKTLEVKDIEILWKQNEIGFIAILSKIMDDKSATEIVQIQEQFYDMIPELYATIQKDTQAILDTDPAADCIQEIINSYPGFFAIAIYRIANKISKLSVPLIPRVLTEYAHSITGVDIHPNATIDVPFIIDHGTGIVIGETAIIGKNVCIYQGVTLGALQVDKSMEEKKRHPTVEDNVVIYANSTILGGSTIIGNHSIIGGNTFIAKSVNPYSLVMQSSKNTILNQQEITDINTFAI